MILGPLSELVAPRRRDLQPRGDSGQLAVFGKGGKTRSVLLPASVWADLQTLGAGGDTTPDAPVFRSRKGSHLTARQAQRLVDAALAAPDLGLEEAVPAEQQPPMATKSWFQTG